MGARLKRHTHAPIVYIFKEVKSLLAKISVNEYPGSDYRCIGCNRPAERIGAEPNHSRVGVKHKPGCWFYKRLAARFPDLMFGIYQERREAA